jgi:phosphate acyltransferase
MFICFTRGDHIMKIALDAMGGDHAPAAVVDGCLMALKEYPDIHISLFGKQTEIEHCLGQNQFDKSRLSIVPCSEVITNHEHPVEAIKGKKDASMVRAFQSLSEGNSDVFVSAGNTGAVLAGAILIVRRIRGIKRPGLSPILPTMTGNGVLLIDCGANVDCRPEHLAQFAVMGSIYMEKVMGVSEPRVGLVNNGAEAEKGSELTKASFELLQRMPIRFTGNCEGRDAFSGEFDVIVTDGFVGNVLLKTTEGVGMMLTKLLKNELKSNLRSKIGALLCMPALRNFKSKIDYTEYGGAPLLGISGGVIKAHGSSDAKAIKNSIRQARQYVLSGVTERIEEAAAHLVLD